ncbi:IS1249 family transposase [Phytoactinopolyspora halotolerans]|uniref:IS1249 family transposase n=1 Tax=Phytoactinopolyspora halotolerans TaxID=1981512 RepID=A0A6L9S887_9ACTN|nr:IS1249 family transposase [Phytoactinopolyspora halotolerans]
MVCGGRLKRNGTTSAGRTRWRCASCGASSTRSRPDVTRRGQLEAFVAWLTGTGCQHDTTPASARSFRRQSAWCWRVEPSIAVTGEVYDCVQLDGIYLSGGWCCLIAITRGHPIAWQWCDQEKKVVWAALMNTLPAPRVVVTDGGRGIHAALGECWATTRVQRCLVHVQRNMRTYLTSKPRTDAGKALWALGKQLTRLPEPDDAAKWLVGLNAWHELYGHLTRQRTYRSDDTLAPSWVKPTQTWWYTHANLRKAYRLLQRLAREQTLFTYLDPDLADLQIASTTNWIEGGINAQLRRLLATHRGMTCEHQRRAIEWYLYLHSEHHKAPAKLINPEHYTPNTPRHREPRNEPIGPVEYDIHPTAEEGLWARKGWAGRP